LDQAKTENKGEHLNDTFVHCNSDLSFSVGTVNIRCSSLLHAYKSKGTKQRGRNDGRRVKAKLPCKDKQASRTRPALLSALTSSKTRPRTQRIEEIEKHQQKGAHVRPAYLGMNIITREQRPRKSAPPFGASRCSVRTAITGIVLQRIWSLGSGGTNLRPEAGVLYYHIPIFFRGVT
jgi:hypothetical protein